MPIAKHFLGYKQPGLDSAADYLVARYSNHGMLNLEQALIVVPGGLAGQRLLEKLLNRVGEQKLQFLPPQITTGGTFLELLYSPPGPFAGELLSRIAWGQALQSSPPAVIEKFAPHPPDSDASEEWQRLGGYLVRLHRELAGEGLDFGQVARHGRKVKGFAEVDRWNALQQVLEKYLGILAKNSLVDRQMARLEAVQSEACTTDRDVFLLAMPDMNRVQRQMISQVSNRVTVLVYAPKGYDNRFDEIGCLVPEVWRESPVEISDSQIHVAENAESQAAEVVRCLAEYEGKYRADQITIGVPDELLVPHLQRELAEQDIAARWLVGRAMSESGPYRLLAVVRDYLSIGGAAEFSALVRHPDLDRWLTGQSVGSAWLTELDQYNSEHLPLKFGKYWMGGEEEYQQLKQAYALTTELLEAFTGTRQPLGTWCDQLCSFMAKVYEGQETDRITAEACELLAATMIKLKAIPAGLNLPVTASEAIRIVCQETSGDNIPAEPVAEAVNILGWLELALDDSPALVVTSMNEQFVPKSITGDLFLPGNLRKSLELDDNTRRYARDAYVLEIFLKTRTDLDLIVARADTEKNPLAPSRLLFATDGNTIARRVIRLYGDDDQPRSAPLIGRLVSDRAHSDFAPPDPVRQEQEIDFLRVSDFKNYLRCPYRFYLERVLRLRVVDDQAMELEPRQFGNLIHWVLDEFGKSELKDSCNAEDIEGFLHKTLQQKTDYYFGRHHHRRPAIAVQVLQVEERLKAFARWQANRAAAGWQIEHVEIAADGEKPALLVDGKPMELRGRIDRIDIHQSGAVAIFDYKTGNKVENPQSTHRKKKSGEWTDLQLPLYRHIFRSLGIDGNPQLGYIALPEDTSKTGVLMADWSANDLVDADEAAFEIVRKIRRQEFSTIENIDAKHDDYSAICMSEIFERPAAGGTQQ